MMPRGDRLTFGQHPEEDIFKKLVRAMFIGIGERRAVDGANAEMVKALCLTGQAGLDAAQAVLPRKLAEEHRDEMSPGPETPAMILGSRLLNGFLKFKSRKHFHHLPQDGMIMRHRLILLAFQWLWLAGLNHYKQ